MDSTGFNGQRIARTLALALATFGCASQRTADFTAPRSTLTRAKALGLAKAVAASIDGKVYAVAPSGSMIPTLDEGSIVTVENVTLDELKRGDIVIYRAGSGLVVIHRLYEKHRNCWFVLGDNNSSIDLDTVTPQNLLGRVCAIFYTATDKTAGGELPRTVTAFANRP